MRVHELALARWLHQNFTTRPGCPTPVVFATPMDAAAEFDRLFKSDGNPFAYLTRDERGRVIDPYPANLKYPLFSVMRKGWNFRPNQNYSFHTNRRVGWPSVSSVADGLIRKDLGAVYAQQMPMAWDFSFQLDHYAMRTDTQAMFVQRLMSTLARTTASTPSTFLFTVHPGIANGKVMARMVIGNPVDATEREPTDSLMVFRTSVDITIEGWSWDYDLAVVPTVWNLVLQGSGVDPALLGAAYTFALTDFPTANPTMEGRPNLPPVASSGTIVSNGTTP